MYFVCSAGLAGGRPGGVSGEEGRLARSAGARVVVHADVVDVAVAGRPGPDHRPADQPAGVRATLRGGARPGWPGS